jgi:uncharacterized protein YggE
VDALRAVLDRYAPAIEKRETSSAHVWPDVKRSGERVVAYNGSATTTINVTDFSVVGELVMALAGLEQTTVTGPYWSLRPDSPVYQEVREAAITDAIARARGYAAALGSRVERLVELADSGMSGVRPVDRMLTAAYTAQAAPALDLDPQRQVVNGTVEARFEIAPPVLDKVD